MIRLMDIIDIIKQHFGVQTINMKIHINKVIWRGAFFEDVFSPNGWQKNSQNCKNPKCADLVGYNMVLPISICKLISEVAPVQ